MASRIVLRTLPALLVRQTLPQVTTHSTPQHSSNIAQHCAHYIAVQNVFSLFYFILFLTLSYFSLFSLL